MVPRLMVPRLMVPRLMASTKTLGTRLYICISSWTYFFSLDYTCDIPLIHDHKHSGCPNKFFRNIASYLVSRGHTPFRKRGKGSGNFHLLASPRTYKAAACDFTVCFTLVTSYWGCDNSTHVTKYCAVIGPALYRAAQQTASYKRALPPLHNGMWPRETTTLWVWR